jgi:peptidoglycan/xylan/chitin deacetylase (PgdA/CDA1 family)
MIDPVYSADKSLGAKIRRKMTRLFDRKMVYFPKTLGPRISISFDDVPASTTLETANMLDELGIKATYYISAGLMDKQGAHLGGYATKDQIIQMAQSGHEIGCHTFSHLDCAQETQEKIIADLRKNAQFFKDCGLSPPKNFAYPYGEVSRTAKKIMTQRFASARALHPGLIQRYGDANQLPSIGLEGKVCLNKYEEWLNHASEQNGWLILYTHDIRDTPSKYGTDLKTLKSLLVMAKDKGFRFLTVDSAVSEAFVLQDAVARNNLDLKANLA